MSPLSTGGDEGHGDFEVHHEGGRPFGWRVPKENPAGSTRGQLYFKLGDRVNFISLSFQFFIELLKGIKIELNGEDKQRFEELTEIQLASSIDISVNSSNRSLSSPLSSIFIPSRSFIKN